MNKKVLIVDGDKQLIPILKEAFHKIGFDVFVEPVRDRALEFAQENQPDLVIASVELPAGPAEGYLVCKDFKSSAELKNIPLLLTSRNAKEEDFNKHRKLKTRADDYLKKPFTDEELFQRVENLLGFEISKQDYNQLEEKMHTYLEQQTKLEDELKERDEEIRKLRERLEAVDEAATQQDEAQIEELNKKIAEQEKAIKQLKAELAKKPAIDPTEIEQIKEGYEERLRDLEALQDGYKSKNKELQTKTAQQDKKLEELQARDAKQAEQISSLIEERQELDEQVAELQKKLADIEKRQSDQAGERAELEAEIERLKAAEGERDDELKRLQNELDAAMSEMKELDKDIKTQRKQNEKIRAAAEKLLTLLPEATDDADSDTE